MDDEQARRLNAVRDALKAGAAVEDLLVVVSESVEAENMSWAELRPSLVGLTFIVANLLERIKALENDKPHRQ